MKNIIQKLRVAGVVSLVIAVVLYCKDAYSGGNLSAEEYSKKILPYFNLHEAKFIFLILSFACFATIFSIHIYHFFTTSYFKPTEEWDASE